MLRLPEVFVGGEGLARGPAEVLGTLLHEASHALGHVRGIKAGAMAQRPVQVTKDSRIGWSSTTIPANTRETYAAVIAELGRGSRRR
jgi:hypothetical protein